MRNVSGVYYLQAKVAGKKVRESLGTEELAVAKIKRDERLLELRAIARARALAGEVDGGLEGTGEAAGDVEGAGGGAGASGGPGGRGKGLRGVAGVRTVGDALGVAVVRMKEGVKRDLKGSSRDFYGYLEKGLRRSLPVDLPGARWSRELAGEWWKVFAKRYSATHANNALRTVKLMTEELERVGLCPPGICAGLRRRAAAGQRKLRLPGWASLQVVIAEIRRQDRAFSVEAADLVEFLAWSGLRISEAREVRWEDVGPVFLRVTGGATGTKNRQERMVPVNGPLREVVERRREACDGQGAAGKLWGIKTPVEALRGACGRLNVPRLKVHDLRHWFATRAIESGVDIPTVAKWLGHRDGGALAMRTYGHLRDDHSVAAAKLMG